MLLPCLDIFVTVCTLDPQYLRDYATRLTSEELWFDSWQRQEVFSPKRLVRICSSSSLLVSARLGICTRCVKLTADPHTVSRLKMSYAKFHCPVYVHGMHGDVFDYNLSKFEKLPSFYQESNIVCDFVKHLLALGDGRFSPRSR
jgi:hypothetical protein